MAKEIIDVVDENDNVVDQEDRDIVHKKGLWHRHVHVWVFNSKGQVFLQRRSKSAASQPGLLDPTAGGHLPAGMDYEEAGLMELEEETSIKTDKRNLIFLKKFKHQSNEPSRGIINNVFSGEYGYRYDGDVHSLRPEAKYGEEAGIGFEVWSIEDILNLKDENLRKRFVQAIFNEQFTGVLQELRRLSNE